MITVDIPLRLHSLLNVRWHHMKKAAHVKEARSLARAALSGKTRPELPVTVTIIRIADRKLDRGDNLEASCKPIRDGVADWLKINDGDEEKATWKCDQERGDYGVRIEICGR